LNKILEDTPLFEKKNSLFQKPCTSGRTQVTSQMSSCEN
jgi:hypothetical protein